MSLKEHQVCRGWIQTTVLPKLVAWRVTVILVTQNQNQRTIDDDEEDEEIHQCPIKQHNTGKEMSHNDQGERVEIVLNQDRNIAKRPLKRWIFTKIELKLTRKTN